MNLEIIVAPDLVVRLAPTVVLESFEDGGLALRLKDRYLFELNPTACSTLAHTNGVFTAAQVAALLADEYPVPLDVAMQDVAELYRQLLDDGILEKLPIEACS